MRMSKPNPRKFLAFRVFKETATWRSQGVWLNLTWLHWSSHGKKNSGTTGSEDDRKILRIFLWLNHLYRSFETCSRKLPIFPAVRIKKPHGNISRIESGDPVLGAHFFSEKAWFAESLQKGVAERDVVQSSAFLRFFDVDVGTGL